MATIFTYKVRSGNAVSKLCDSTTSQGVLVFTFGTETQEVINCSYDTQVLKSADMCLLGGEYFSANYKGLPGKVNGQLVFSSVITKKPLLQGTYNAPCNSSEDF